MSLIVLFLITPVNADVVINEIMYNPSGSDNNHEWIEIYNDGNEEINLDDWRFNEADSDHRLTLEQGENMLIEPDEYILIVQNTGTFLEDHEDYEGKILDSSFSLSNAGEYLALKNSDGEIMDEVEYSNEWGNGEQGFSLELIHPNLDNEIGENWDSSENEGGTPGEQNSIFDEGVNDFIMQEINLRSGWNLISSYIIPNDLNLEIIFETLIEEENLILVKDENGRFFSPIGDFNNIGDWNPQEAYYVKVSEETSFIIEGEETINLEIELNEGWNNIAYPLNQAYSMEEIIENVLQPLIEEEQLELLKNGIGRFFIPRWNFNNIPEMNPGNGYMIKVTENTTIDFSQIG